MRRYRPGRRRADRPRREGPQDRRLRSPHRGHARGVRLRVPLEAGPLRRRLRAQVPARHVHRAPAARQEAGGSGARHRLRRAGPRLHRQGQRPGALRADLQGARSAASGDRTVARVGHRFARGRHRIRPRPQRPDLRIHHQDLQPRPQYLAHLARGRRARRPRQRRARRNLDAHQEPGGSARQARRSHHRLREGRARRGERQAHEGVRAARNPQRHRRGARHRPHRPGGEPLRRHEVARLLRDSRRLAHHVRHPRARSPDARQEHPALQAAARPRIRRDGVQRPVVHAAARSARRLLREGQRDHHRRDHAAALQGQHRPRQPQVARTRSTRSTSPASPWARATTRRTRSASSTSSGCPSKCAPWRRKPDEALGRTFRNRTIGGLRALLRLARFRPAADRCRYPRLAGLRPRARTGRHPHRRRARGDCRRLRADPRRVGRPRVLRRRHRRGRPHAGHPQAEGEGGGGGRQDPHRPQPQRAGLARYAPLAAGGVRAARARFCAA